MQILYRDYPGFLAERYKLNEDIPADGLDSWELLQLIGRRRGMLVSGGGVDTERAAAMLLDEFRGGKIGRITLEKPQ